MEGKDEEQPTCSKKTSRTSFEHDGREKKVENRDDGRRDEDRSEYTGSNSSINSRIEMANQMSKSPLAKKDLKMSGVEEKKRVTAPGRVTKRGQQIPTRRQPRRACRRNIRYKGRQEKKRRAPSVSTVFTRLSSGSSFGGSVCRYCGYRTPRRYHVMRRGRNRKIPKRRNIKNKSLPLKLVMAQKTASACLQVGSRGIMLSPLMIKENRPPLEEAEEREYCEITPQMIHFSLRELMMWRHDVEITYIAEYLKNHYPVCQNMEELLKELREKLRIAAIVGMVTESSINYWCLSAKLNKRNLDKNHVTMFWKIYGDTLRPIKRARVEPQDGPSNILTNPNTNTII